MTSLEILTKQWKFTTSMFMTWQYSSMLCICQHIGKSFSACFSYLRGKCMYSSSQRFGHTFIFTWIKKYAQTFNLYWRLNESGSQWGQGINKNKQGYCFWKRYLWTQNAIHHNHSSVKPGRRQKSQKQGNKTWMVTLYFAGMQISNNYISLRGFSERVM